MEHIQKECSGQKEPQCEDSEVESVPGLFKGHRGGQYIENRIGERNRSEVRIRALPLYILN